MELAKSWLEYYNQLQKDIALKLCTDVLIEYGEIIYQSPMVKGTRWLVTSFNNEYNVFFEKPNKYGNLERKLGATFSWKDTALKFALEMFLVCSGRLRRRDRYNLFDGCSESGYF